jgi:hypothetical protein
LYLYLLSLSSFFFAGYPLSQYTIRPFGDHKLTTDSDKAAARKRWNIKMSSARQVVEHAFGRLKGRFGVLWEMPGYNIDKIYKYIESMLILHNILEELHDDPKSIKGYHGEEYDNFGAILQTCAQVQAASDGPLAGDALTLSGVLRCKVLLQQMLDAEAGL